jgi:AcrR family transcriptional regulator
MPTKSRRPNREEVRASILKTARDIAAVDGWAAVTVRKVAEQIGYTAPIIYEHFGSKDEMLNQVLKQGYDMLYESMKKGMADTKTGEERVRALVMGFWGFAHETPELYHLMYGMEGARATSEKARDYAAPMVAFIAEELIRFDPEHISPENVSRIMVEAWGTVHGMIALEMSGYTDRYVPSNELPELLVSSVLRTLRRQ